MAALGGVRPYVRVFAADDTEVFAFTTRSAIPLLPWEASEAQVRVDLDEVRAEAADLLIPVAPRSDATTGSTYVCSGSDCGSIEFALSGPGVYRISADGVERDDAADDVDDANDRNDGENPVVDNDDDSEPQDCGGRLR
ncbi:MAG: hypothetical protein AAF411_12915 [Myxococcota bacterium]